MGLESDREDGAEVFCRSSSTTGFHIEGKIKVESD